MKFEVEKNFSPREYISPSRLPVFLFFSYLSIVLSVLSFLSKTLVYIGSTILFIYVFMNLDNLGIGYSILLVICGGILIYVAEGIKESLIVISAWLFLTIGTGLECVVENCICDEKECYCEGTYVYFLTNDEEVVAFLYV